MEAKIKNVFVNFLNPMFRSVFREKYQNKPLNEFKEEVSEVAHLCIQSFYSDNPENTISAGFTDKYLDEFFIELNN